MTTLDDLPLATRYALSSAAKNLAAEFVETEAGTDVKFETSYGASGDQSRAVEAGGEAHHVVGVHDVPGGAHVHRVDAAEGVEEERAVARALEQEEAGAAEEALGAAPLGVEVHRGRRRQVGPRVEHELVLPVHVQVHDVATGRSTLRSWLELPVSPDSEVTVSAQVMAPASAKVKLTTAPSPTLPSEQLQA